MSMLVGRVKSRCGDDGEKQECLWLEEDGNGRVSRKMVGEVIREMMGMRRVKRMEGEGEEEEERGR